MRDPKILGKEGLFKELPLKSLIILPAPPNLDVLLVSNVWWSGGTQQLQLENACTLQSRAARHSENSFMPTQNSSGVHIESHLRKFQPQIKTAVYHVPLTLQPLLFGISFISFFSRISSDFCKDLRVPQGEEPLLFQWFPCIFFQNGKGWRVRIFGTDGARKMWAKKYVL